MIGRLDPLDALLGALLGLGVVVAGVLGILERPVPDLVEYVTVACLAGLGLGRRPRRETDSGTT